MNNRYSRVHFGLIFFSLVLVNNGTMAIAQQDTGHQSQQLMSPVSGLVQINSMGLIEYEAAAGDLTLCANDSGCLKHAKMYQSMLCASAVCEGTDKSKKVVDCFEGAFKRSSSDVREKIGSSMCAFIESPSSMTRQAFLGHISDDEETTEKTLVEYGAYILALKGSETSCEQYIKNNISPNTFEWYRSISGCRILARANTRVSEEKDYYTWFNARQGSGNCSGIINIDLRKACANGEKFPTP